MSRHDPHPYANLFPMMSAERLQSLADSIAKLGLQHPIILDREEQIIDGRNRYRACEIAGVTPVFTTFEGNDADILDRVMAENLERRDLTHLERVEIAVKAANLSNGGDRRSPEIRLPEGSLIGGVTIAEAAKAVDVSPREVARMKLVMDKGTPELNTAVKEGLSLRAAEPIARLPAEEQPAAIEQAKQPRKKPDPQVDDSGLDLVDDAPVVAVVGKKDRGVGIEKAHAAINILKSIPLADPLGEAGYRKVADWIKKNPFRSKANGD